MINNKLKKCCENCPHIEVCTDTIRSLDSATTVIYCEHMNVCRMYYNAQCEESGESLKNIICGNNIEKDEKEEMNKEKTVNILLDMIKNFNIVIPNWESGCDIRKLLESQREACCEAINALNQLKL